MPRRIGYSESIFTPVTETLSAATGSFEQRQLSRREGLLRALERGTKR